MATTDWYGNIKESSHLGCPNVGSIILEWILIKEEGTV
jgi:hypothetical protein